VKKNPIKLIKILKKPTSLVRFYKSETEKLNRAEPKQKKPGKKPSQTESNQFEPVFVLKNRTETSRFELVSVFFKKKFYFNYIFL
jgi:hypothetical protein